MSAPDLDSIRARIVERVNGYGSDDLRVLDAVTEVMPFAHLKATLEGITAGAAEPIGTPNVYTPTPARLVALSELLATLRRFRVLLGMREGTYPTSTSELLQHARAEQRALVKHGGRS